MRIPSKAIIPPGKLDRYLLTCRAINDKSRYLAKAGFNLTNVSELELAIRRVTEAADATAVKTNEHGTYYNIRCIISGPSGNIPVVLVWLYRLDGVISFVTLVPDKENNRDSSKS